MLFPRYFLVIFFLRPFLTSRATCFCISFFNILWKSDLIDSIISLNCKKRAETYGLPSVYQSTAHFTHHYPVRTHLRVATRNPQEQKNTKKTGRWWWTKESSHDLEDTVFLMMEMNENEGELPRFRGHHPRECTRWIRMKESFHDLENTVYLMMKINESKRELPRFVKDKLSSGGDLEECVHWISISSSDDSTTVNSGTEAGNSVTGNLITCHSQDAPARYVTRLVGDGHVSMVEVYPGHITEGLPPKGTHGYIAPPLRSDI